MQTKILLYEGSIFIGAPYCSFRGLKMPMDPLKYYIDGVLNNIPDFFRKFNRDVKGYSVCASTRDNLAKSWLNVAEPGGVCT